MRGHLDCLGLVASGALTLAGMACATERAAGPSTQARAAFDDDVVDATLEQRGTQTMRVLVTGFNDWTELGEPPNLWRCRDNPSCRLLLGAAHDETPTLFEGPLARRLRAAAPEHEWRFATLPVTWEVFAEVPRDVDVIVNIGLGVYHRFDLLQLEAGAYNLRRGTDAAGAEQGAPIDPELGVVLEPPAGSPIPARLSALAGRSMAGYEVAVAAAREGNSYLCNETHFRALSAVHGEAEGEGEDRLREVYFLHIPYAEGGDYEALAAGVAGVILDLLGPMPG